MSIPSDGTAVRTVERNTSVMILTKVSLIQPKKHLSVLL